MAVPPHSIPCAQLPQLLAQRAHQFAHGDPTFLPPTLQAQHAHNVNLQNGVTPMPNTSLERCAWIDRCDSEIPSPGSVNTPFAKFSDAVTAPSSLCRQTLITQYMSVSTSLGPQQAGSRPKGSRRQFLARKTALKEGWMDIVTELPGGGIQANGVRASDGTSILHGESDMYH